MRQKESVANRLAIFTELDAATAATNITVGRTGSGSLGITNVASLACGGRQND